MYVVMAGSPADGMTLYGPFYTTEGANEWADHEKFNCSWWVVSVEEVSSDKDDILIDVGKET